jgi:hypothetical protein
MKTIRSIATASVILLTICHTYGLSFTYSYSDVFDASAEDFLVNQSNVQKVNEGIVHYYSPITPDTPASLTYHFDLSGTITDASLFAHLGSYNFGGGLFGFGSLWGSTDGTTWQLLMDALTPSSIAQGYFYDQSGYYSLQVYSTICQACGLTGVRSRSPDTLLFLLPWQQSGVLILQGGLEEGKCRLSAHWWRGLSVVRSGCNNTHYCARDESSPPQRFHSKASLSASAVCRVCS